jgi:DNA polymerase III delta prime subunit
MTILEQVIWTEIYRPKTVQECILPNRLKTMFQNIVNSGEMPHMLLYGSAGVGKTSVAKAMCTEMGLTYLFTNGSKERSINYVRETIAPFAGTIAFNGKRKVVIIDEADGSTGEYQDALKSLIETYSKNCSFIFIANRPAKLIDPIHSRTGGGIEFRIYPEEREEMVMSVAQLARSILKKEEAAYDITALMALVKKHFPDIRRLVTALQSLAKRGKITDEMVKFELDPDNYAELYQAMKNKNLKVTREWLVKNVDFLSIDSFIRHLYDHVKVYLKPESIPAAVMIFGQYQYYAAFVVDQEINSMAMLTDLMSQCEFL